MFLSLENESSKNYPKVFRVQSSSREVPKANATSAFRGKTSSALCQKLSWRKGRKLWELCVDNFPKCCRFITLNQSQGGKVELLCKFNNIMRKDVDI